MSDMTTELCMDALLKWISYFGIPNIITSDLGRQFESHLWSSVMSRFGISHHTTTSYHPQSNGLVKRFHRQLKDSLRAKMSSSSWTSHLPVVLLAFCNTIKPDIGFSPAQMTFGCSLKLPGALFNHDPKNLTCDSKYMRSLMAVCASFSYIKPNYHCHSKVQTLKDLETCDYVYVYDKTARGLCPTYKGPYRILSRDEKFFRLTLDHKEDSVLVDRPKPAKLRQDQDSLPSTFTRFGRAAIPPRRL
jgi:transposase InsO family protein